MKGPLTTRTVSAVRITLLGSLATVLVQCLILVLLARLLTAEDYGLYVLATAVARLSTGLVVGSLERSLIVGPQERIDAASGLQNVLLAATASLGGLAAYWLLATAAGATHVEPLALVVLMASFPSAFAVGIRADLRRQLRFLPITAGDLAGQVLGTGLVAVLCAAAGWGAYALAAGALVQSLTSAICLVLLTRHSRRSTPPGGLGTSLRQIWPAMQTSFTEIFNGQIPALLIPSLLGVDRLGLLNRIVSLVQLPVEIAVSAITRVLVAGLVLAREDRERLLRALGRAVTLTAAFACPLIAGMIACREDFIAVILGPRWVEGTALVPFLAVSACAAMVGCVFSLINEAMGLFREKTAIQVASSALLVLGLIAGGLLYGLTGAAAALSAASLLWLVLSMRCAGRRLKVGLPEMAAWLCPGLGAACLTAIAGWGVAQLAHPALPPVASLGVQIAACGAAAAVYYALFHRRLLVEALDHLGLGRFLPTTLRANRGLSDA